MSDTSSHVSSDVELTVRAKRKILYVAPDTTVIEELAQQVCATLGEKYEAYRDPEVIDGLAAFLAVIAHLAAKSLTEGKADWIRPKRRKK